MLCTQVNMMFVMLLWVYTHTGRAWKICPATAGIEPTTFGILAQYYSNRPDRVAQLVEHWASIPKVVGSIPTVAGHIFQARPVWIYTQSNITNIIFTWVHNTKQKKSYY